MQLLPDDEPFLQRALELARQAAAFASPNPTVGCVLVDNGAILGEGAHSYDSLDHAEIAALKEARSRGLSLEKSTAYVTLEPCAHHGRTGPCALALVEAGVQRCVIATVDPNPQVSGRGIQILRDAGVLVDVLPPAEPLAQAARELNDAFAFAVQHGRPFVLLKAAVSLDGYLAPAPANRSCGKPHWLTGEAARRNVQLLRHSCDAILTGVGTVLADNPSLTDRSGLPRRRPLLRVVLDSQLRTPIFSALLQNASGDLLICTTGSASESLAEQLRLRGAEVLRVTGHTGRVDLHAVLQTLEERGVRSLLVEAGSAVNAGLLAADLVDKITLYYADTELGHGSVPFAEFTHTPYALQAGLYRTTREEFPSDAHGVDVKVSGYIHDPWSGVA